MKNICDRLRDLREDNDLTQLDVAKYIGTTQQYYSKYETGRHELPIRFLYKLSELYNVSADYLLGRTDCPGGINKYDPHITDDCTSDELLAKLTSLSMPARIAVIEYIKLWLRAEKENKKA